MRDEDEDQPGPERQGYFLRFSYVFRTMRLFEPLKPAFSFHYVLIVPLDILRLSKPLFRLLGIDLGNVLEEHRGVFELFSEDRQPFFFKVCPAPKHQPDSLLLSAVTDDRISVEEPDRMCVPDLVFGFRECSVYRPSQQITDRSVTR